jgi:outer membrane protein TolC
MKRHLLIIGCCILAGRTLRAADSAVPHFSLNLTQAIAATFERSHELQKAALLAQSAEDKARAQRGPMFPKLSIEGSYRHVSEVPELAFPGGQKIQLTDNKNYPIAPRWNSSACGS